MSLRNNLPPFVWETADMAELLAAQQPQIDRLDKACTAMRGSFFLDSLTPESATLWEKQLGFSPAPAWTPERRRDRLKARLFLCPPLTPTGLADCIRLVGGVACTVTENPAYARITVSFTGEMGIPVHIQEIMAEVERVRPLHLTVDYAYLFALLSAFSGCTLGQLAGETLAEMTAGVLPA